MSEVRRPAGHAPRKAYGQHFLVDPNILDVIGRLARLGPDDVVLEIGPGLGVLTTHLADRVALVHAVEIDRALEEPLRSALGGRANVHLVLGDALRLDLAALDPAPTKLVANLPYNVATPIVVESLEGLPSIASWCVMVQREVVDRWLAEPGGRLYGAPSVLLRLTAEVTFRRAVGREVFTPRPRVDSSLVALRRVAAGPAPAVRSLVRAAFAARRKTLVNALALAGADRARVAEALAALGHPPAVRPEALPPEAFPALARELAWPG